VVVRAAATSTLTRQSVPLELEEGPMPLNTFNNKAPFKAKIKSVERIVGPKATGETCNIVIETEGKIPFWEGQSYGVIPPVSASGKGVSN
jgi:ferredoxin--NADP+ reductase